MICANCQMVGQRPEAPCSHCGRMLPAAEATFVNKPEDSEDAGDNEAGADGADAGEGQDGADESAVAETQATPETESQAEEVVPQDGHVDNVGDESETETILP